MKRSVTSMAQSRLKLRAALLLGTMLLLSGCGDNPQESAPVIRPVLTVIAKAEISRQTGFAGSVEPQFSTDLAFRVLGRLIQRNVNIGDFVEKSQIVAMIDPTQLDLNLQAAKADLASAEAKFANAFASEERQAKLLASRSIAQASYDSARQGLDTAIAEREKARAALHKAQEERSYAQLEPDFSGVVSAIGAEVGQVVSAGQSIITVAQPDIREAVVDVPDHVAETITRNDRFLIVLQADPSVKVDGHVREVAPQADSVTRLRRVKITLDHVPQAFRLGTTITALRSAPADKKQIILPITALLEQDGKAYVWVAEAETQTVHRREIEIISRSDQSFIAAGISQGQHIVRAGVHSLQDGQQVRLAEGDGL